MGTQGWGKDETTRNVDSTNGDGTSADFYNHWELNCTTRLGVQCPNRGVTDSQHELLIT